ncbi:MAG: hypothetical protein KC420_15150, partial [Myxococcales bacterium]|nr:hypothetical protein [Myxococcales bacterium]
LGTPQLRPDVPAELARLIERLLERPLDARPASAEEVRNALTLLASEAKRADSTASGVAPAAALSASGGETRPELIGGGETRPELSPQVSAVAPPPARQPGSPPRVWLVVGASLVLMIVVVLVLALRSGDDAEVAVAGTETKTDAKADADHPEKEAPKVAVKTAETAASATIREQGEMSESVQRWFHTVSTNRSDGQRQKAAKEILEHEPASEVPEVARLVAELQMAEACAEKKDVVDKLAALKDPRGVETLRRYEPRGYHACGRKDCYGCMRAAMAAALRAMGAEPSEQTREAIGELE